jgi:cobalt/nickel transport system ATP-binding protein
LKNWRSFSRKKPDDSMNVLAASSVSYSYLPQRDVLRGVSFAVGEGERVGLVGANGAGKSTLLKLFVGLLSPAEGCVSVAGMKVEKRNFAAVRRAAGYVFQDAESQLFLNTVGEDVAFGPRNEGLPEDEVFRRTSEALSAVGLADLHDECVYRLSGGQKRLAAVATVLSMRPQALLLDEPTLALDPRNRRNVMRVLKGLPCAQLIATHDLDFVLDVCSRVLLLSGGGIVADGYPEEILRNRNLLEAHGLELPLSLAGR